jgi:hypothetical protein
MLLDFGIDKGAPVDLQLSQRAFLIGAHEPAVSSDIGREDRCEPSFRTLFSQGRTPEYTKVFYRVSTTGARTKS